MKTSLDLRSVFIAILLTLCILFVLGFAQTSNPDSNARFQLALPAEGNNAFVIDTATGKVWERYPVSGPEAAIFRKAKLTDVLVNENK